MDAETQAAIKDMAAEIRFLRKKIAWCEENIRANMGVD